MKTEVRSPLRMQSPTAPGHSVASTALRVKSRKLKSRKQWVPLWDEICRRTASLQPSTLRELAGAGRGDYSYVCLYIAICLPEPSWTSQKAHPFRKGLMLGL